MRGFLLSLLAGALLTIVGLNVADAIMTDCPGPPTPLSVPDCRGAR